MSAVSARSKGKQQRRRGKPPRSLLALGSATVLTVYLAGYRRTQPTGADTSSLPVAPMAAPVDSGAITEAARRDGTYSGWGSSRHGDIQASVEIRQGKLVGVTIQQCLTRYSCAWVADLPAQVVARQSPRVDFVSGATQSSEAFSAAVADALKHAL